MMSYSPRGYLRQINKKLRPMLTLSFDDGTKGDYNVTAPTMEKYGMRGSFYIISDEVGKTNRMTAAQIKELSDRGHEIGSHTKTHPDLRTLTNVQLQEEFLQSKLAIQNIIQKPVQTIAYPYGYTDDRVDNIAGAYYEAARGTDKNILPSPYILWNLDSVMLYGRKDNYNTPSKHGDPRTVVQLKTMVDDLLALEEPAWFVFYLHEVFEDDDLNRPDNRLKRSDFEQFVAYASTKKEAGELDIVTYLEGARRIYGGTSIHI